MFRLNAEAVATVCRTYTYDHRIFNRTVFTELLHGVYAYFDHDPIKHERYRRAVDKALDDLDLTGDHRSMYRRACFEYGRVVQRVAKIKRHQRRVRWHKDIDPSTTPTAPKGTQLVLDV